MAVVVEAFIAAAWVALESYIPFHGDAAQGIIPFELEKVRENNIGVLSFGMDSSAVNPAPGQEIRVVVDGTQRFGGYITTREQTRRGAATTMRASNYACQDYNSILDRIVVPSYTIDAGDTDSTEIETLRATYLAGIGITAGTISTIDAAMEEITLSGTFRECMASICAAVGGAIFYVSAGKTLNYGNQAWAAIGAENLSDDLTVASSHPYADYVLRDDESRRVNAVYIIGEGIQGWYPDPPGANYYQMIISDPSVTTQALLDLKGAAIVDDFEYPLEESSLTCWNQDVWEYDRVRVRHSDLIGGAGDDLWVRRSMMRARAIDATELEFDLEFGDHTIESDNLGPPTGSGGGGGMTEHIILSSPYHSDANEYTVTRGALIVGDSTPEWDGLAHPAAAGYALTTDANDTAWDQTPTWTGLHTFGAGWALSGGTGDLNGNDLILDADGDSYLHASGDDIVDLVLATSSGEFGIHVNGAEDFTFTANLFTCTTGSDIDLNGNDLIIDADGDTYLHASADDVISIAIAGNEQYDFDATELTFSTTGGQEILWIRTSGNTQTVRADIYANNRLGIAADDDVYVFIDAANDDSDSQFVVANHDDTVDGSTKLFRIGQAPVMYLNETANSKMSIGFTVNQGTNDDEILAFKSDTLDVDHGVTDITDTNTWGFFKKAAAAAGGMRIGGMRDSGAANSGAMWVQGFLDENVDTTKTTAGRAIVEIFGYQTSGTGIANTVADGNVWCVRTQRGGSTVTLAIINVDGDFYYDGALNNYDAEDDALAVRDLQRGLTGRWAETLAYNRERFQELGVLGHGEAGAPLVSTKGLAALMTGAIGQSYDERQQMKCVIDQLYDQCQSYERAFAALGVDPALLEGAH